MAWERPRNATSSPSRCGAKKVAAWIRITMARAVFEAFIGPSGWRGARGVWACARVYTGRRVCGPVRSGGCSGPCSAGASTVEVLRPAEQRSGARRSARDAVGESVSSPELEALKRQVQRLTDLQQLQALRCAYFRCLDTANLAEMKELLTEDFACRCVGGDYVYEARSRAEFLELTANSFHSEIVTQHNGHGAEVELVDETHATGRVYFHDLVYHFRTREFLM